MKTLYLDCGMGAAGDMLTAALIELLPDPDHFMEELHALGIPNVTVSRNMTTKCGICGTQISVRINDQEESSIDHSLKEHTHAHEHTHNRLHDIEHIIQQLNLPKTVISDILTVYTLIAAAESKVHGVPVSDIHFHEVGTLDAITDIAAVCLLMNRLAPDEVVVSPIHVGSGHVHCAHGILPVPAPATAEILCGLPIYSSTIQGELCTPTGAALLKHFATRFGSMPVMTVEKIGYGMGKKDFEVANCVRAMFGTSSAPSTDEMFELNCNVDDMTAEQIGYALEQCFKEGAVEAFTIPIGMKKSRPGTLICVICSSDKKAQLIHSMFKHTSTCGIRELPVKRSILSRTVIPVETAYGTIHRKDYWGYDVKRSKYEHEDLARIASDNNMSIHDLLRELDK